MGTKNISYKEAIENIEGIVEKFQDGDIDIDILAKEVKRASELISICKEKLRGASEEIEKIYSKEQ